MDITQLALLPRGKALMVKPGDKAPINLVAFLNDILAADEATKGVEVEVGPVQGSPGNYILGLSGEAWTRGTKPVTRVRALLKVYDAMVTGGIPEDINDEQLLNLVHSGGAVEGGKGRASRLNIFINASILEKRGGAGAGGGTTTIVQTDPNAAVNAKIEKLSVTYFEKDGDADALLAMQTKFEKSPAVFAGWLENQVKKLGGTVETAATTPASTPAKTEGEGGSVL
jgi:hypothetical protein